MTGQGWHISNYCSRLRLKERVGKHSWVFRGKYCHWVEYFQHWRTGRRKALMLKSPCCQFHINICSKLLYRIIWGKCKCYLCFCFNICNSVHIVRKNKLSYGIFTHFDVKGKIFRNWNFSAEFLRKPLWGITTWELHWLFN